MLVSTDLKHFVMDYFSAFQDIHKHTESGALDGGVNSNVNEYYITCSDTKNLFSKSHVKKRIIIDVLGVPSSLVHISLSAVK